MPSLCQGAACPAAHPHRVAASPRGHPHHHAAIRSGGLRDSSQRSPSRGPLRSAWALSNRCADPPSTEWGGVGGGHRWSFGRIPAGSGFHPGWAWVVHRLGSEPSLMPVGHSVEDQTWRASWSARAPRPATSGRACPWHASSSPADTTSSGTRATASRPPSSAPGRGTSAPTAAVDIDESDLDSSFPGRSKVKSGIPQLKFDLQSIFIDTIPDYLTDLRDVAERHVPDMIVVESAFLAAALLAEERGREEGGLDDD